MDGEVEAYKALIYIEYMDLYHFCCEIFCVLLNQFISASSQAEKLIYLLTNTVQITYLPSTTSRHDFSSLTYLLIQSVTPAARRPPG